MIPPIRGEYQAMMDGLPALMAPFGATLSAGERDDLTVLVAAMERVDATLDSLRDPADRRAFCARVVAVLEHVPVDAPARERDALAAAAELAARARRRNTTLAALVREALDTAERARTARDPRAYAACVAREGELTAEMALRLCAANATFAAFLRAVGPVANFVDKLVDQRTDYAEGSLAIEPGPRLAATLASRLVAGGLRAMALHPDRVAFARWGAHWLTSLRPTQPRPGRRICVVGTSGSGKTFVARALADRLGLTYVSNDAIIWRANWQPTPAADRLAEVDAATRGDAWTFDGNLDHAPEDLLVLSRADTIVWLDLPRRTIHPAIVRRTLRRVWSRERLWHGNVETFRTAPDMIGWAIKTYARRRRGYLAMFAGDTAPPIRVWLRSRREVDAWLA